jgi:ketosteroid isomerase-like protein
MRVPSFGGAADGMALHRTVEDGLSRRRVRLFVPVPRKSPIERRGRCSPQTQGHISQDHGGRYGTISFLTTIEEVLMRKLSVAVAAFLVLVTPMVHAQEWSAEQKDVWKNVQTYWALYDAGNLEGYLSYFHNDYLGWSYRSPLPMDKASMKKFVEYDMKTSKPILSNIKPVAIGVFGNVAYADYYYTVMYKDAEGKTQSESGRWTDILMKQGDKWVLIGDHGGKTSKD